MINFDPKYFQKFRFGPNQADKYLKAAWRDLKISRQSNVAEVQFQFSYNALIKLGIAVISNFGYKIRSKSGHHMKILEKTALILNEKDIYSIGNRMRKKRNTDLYDGGIMISKKETGEYLDWVAEVFKKAEAHLFGKERLF